VLGEVPRLHAGSHGDASAIRLGRPCDELEERRLARAVHPHHAPPLGAPDQEIEPRVDGFLPVVLVDAGELRDVVPRSGRRLKIEAKLLLALGGLDALDLLIRRSERWCVMGVNGAGKSTLLKLVAGAAEPDQGRVSVGASVKTGYFAQHAMELLDPAQTVWDTLIGAFPKASIGSLRTLAGVFGFSGDDIEKPCRILSGGEKARLVLARMLYDPPNFLVLDEPTNHLDMATKEMLVEALAGFEGTMLFVSHDRRFLRALSNRVLEVTPGGVHMYGGGYAEYVSETGQEAPGVRS